MKIHYSVVALVAICVLAATALVLSNKIPPAAVMTVITGVLGWLVPSPLGGAGRTISSDGGTSLPPPKA
jgi:NAD/NADP transhydrogenase beta subunit